MVFKGAVRVFLMWGCTMYITVVGVLPAADDRPLSSCVEKQRVAAVRRVSCGRDGWKMYHDIIVSYQAISIIIDLFFFTHLK